MSDRIVINGGESYTIPQGSLGEPGLSAYQLDVFYRDFEGTVIEWLESQKGADGADGQDGSDGAPGPNVISTATDVSFAGTGLVAFEAGKARAATDADYVTPDELTQAIPDRFSQDPTPTYTDSIITRIDFANGSYKTFTYTDGRLTQIDFVRPGLSTIRKTFSYTGNVWTGTVRTEI